MKKCKQIIANYCYIHNHILGIPPVPGKEESREIRGQTSVTQAPPDPGKEEMREIRGHVLFIQRV